MAKEKQKKSIEELMEEALVSVEQTPFVIPKNWCWVKIGSIANLYTGNSINEKVKSDKYKGLTNGRTYIATKDISFDSKIEYNTGVKIPYNESRFKIAPNGSVLLCIEGGSAGKKIGFLNQDVCFVNKLCCFDYYEPILNLYGFYFLQAAEFYKLFTDQKVGLIGGVSIGNLKGTPFPLAPREEQKRIVEKIETMFSKLDEAKELIQKSLDELEDRKSAILHKAFIGELTYSKDKDNIKEWKKVHFQDIVEDIKYGTSEKSDYDFEGIPVIRIPNIKDNHVNTQDIKYLKTKNYNEVDKLEEGDILIIRSNGSRDLVGRCALVEGLTYYTYASFLMRIRICKHIEPKFIVYYLNSKCAKKQLFLKAKSSSGIHNINSKEVSSINIAYPSLEEQQKIVQILDGFFEKEDKSKKLLDMIDKIKEMKKAILARAFRGELGTHSDADEPAIELLKEILTD